MPKPSRLTVLYTLLCGCSAVSAEQYEIDGVRISLDSAKCLLKVNDKPLSVEMKPKCFVVKHNGSEAGVKYYDDIKSHVLLIVGASAPKDAEYPLTLERSDCGTQLRALIIRNGTALLSSKTFSNGLTCAGVGADQKEYYILSHP